MSLRNNLSGKMPSDYKWARRVLSREWRKAIRLVRANLEPDMTYPRTRTETSGSEIVAVSIVRNEGDIIESVIHNLLAQGVNLVLIADHDSTDDTFEKLVGLSYKNPVIPYRLTVKGFYQEQTITTLATFARKMGARWIVPFDGDEFWFAERGSLSHYLAAQKVAKVYARGLHVYPDYDHGDSISDRGRIDFGTTDYRKVVYRPSRLSYVRHGNHDVVRRGSSADGLRIAHVPVRSFDQLRRKVREGAANMRVAGVTERAKHWHYLDGLSDEELQSYWSVLCDGSGWEDLGWRPRGPFACVRLDGALNWQTLIDPNSEYSSE